MRRSAVCLCAILVFGSALPIHAGDRVGIGAKVGTLGFGVDITGRINNWLDVRGSLNSADVTQTKDVSDISYDGKFALGASGIMLDFFPLKGNFRLSAGYLRNRTGVDMDATPTSNINIGDGNYTPAEVGTLKGTIDFKDNVPYFGLGYGSAPKGPHRIKFIMDIGVLSQGSGNVTLTATGATPGSPLESDLRKEEQQTEDDIKDYHLWPVVAFGIAFRL